MTTSKEIDNLVERLQQLDAELSADHGKKAHVTRVIDGLRNSGVAPHRLAELATLENARPIVAAAHVEIERLIEAAPDWRVIADRRARDLEWGRQVDLLASRKALVSGVEYLGGVACVPNALKKILGVVVEADGREIPRWYGCLDAIDARIAELRKRVDASIAARDSYVQAAEALLTVDVAS